MDSSNSRCYFFVLNGTRVGPVANEELLVFVVRNDVQPATLCWSKGLPRWTAASDVPEVAAALSASPPPLPAVLATAAPPLPVSHQVGSAIDPPAVPSCVTATTTVRRKGIREIVQFDLYYLLCFALCYVPLLFAWIVDAPMTSWITLIQILSMFALAGVILFGSVIGILAVAFVRRRWIWCSCITICALITITANTIITSTFSSDARALMAKRDREEQDRIGTLGIASGASSTTPTIVFSSEDFSVLQKMRREALHRAFPIQNTNTLIADAQRGDTSAMRELGLMCVNGTGVERNDETAVGWLRLSSQQGDIAATSALGWMHLTGRGVARSEPEAVRFYQEASRQGDPISQFSLAMLKLRDKSVITDVDGAMGLLESAAAGGYTPARSVYAALTLNDQMRQANHEQAIRYMKTAAESGDPVGQYNYGLLLMEGAKDQAEAAAGFRWVLTAAEQGLSPAQYGVGYAYATGRGPDQDEYTSLEWLNKSAQQGHASAKHALQQFDQEPSTTRSSPTSSPIQLESISLIPQSQTGENGGHRIHLDHFVQSITEGTDVSSMVSDLEGSNPQLMAGFGHLISDNQRASLAKQASLILNRRRNVYEACVSYANDGWSNNRALYNDVRPVFQQYVQMGRRGAFTQDQVVSFYTDFAARAEQACADCPPVGPVVNTLAQVHYNTAAFHMTLGNAMQACGSPAEASQQFDLSLKHVDEYASNDRRASVLLQTSPDDIIPRRLREEISAARRQIPVEAAPPIPSMASIDKQPAPRLKQAGPPAIAPRRKTSVNVIPNLEMPTRLLPLDWAGMFGFPQEGGSHPPADPNDPNPNRTPSRFTPPDRETGKPPKNPGEWRDKDIEVNCTGNWFQPKDGGDSGYFSTCNAAGEFSTTPTHMQLRASSTNDEELKVVIDSSATPDVSLGVGGRIVWLAPGEQTIVPLTPYRRPNQRGDCLTVNAVVFYYRTK